MPRPKKWKNAKMHNDLGLLFFSVLLFASSHASALVADFHHAEQQYPSGPWGLGVVVPENSMLAGGSRLSWANVSAVSVEVTLPNINYSDYATLAVESLMAADGTVIQIAAGIYPGDPMWLAYGWVIRNVQVYPQTYDWILNSSRPEMSAGASVSLSIYIAKGRWRYTIEDLNTSETASGEYAATIPTTLKTGDQEVFALESYTSSSIVFAHMGNMTLDALKINAKQIVSGWYGYGSWDTRHNPLFVVGGLDPPSYILLRQTNAQTLVWSYEQWSVSTETQPQNFPVTNIASVVSLIGILTLTVAYLIRRRRHDSGADRSHSEYNLRKIYTTLLTQMPSNYFA